MTKRDFDTYHFIIAYIEKNGYSPTIREIATGIGVTSTSAAYNRLMRLKDSGLIQTIPFFHRGIYVIEHQTEKEQ